jgi:hypothetical protein
MKVKVLSSQIISKQGQNRKLVKATDGKQLFTFWMDHDDFRQFKSGDVATAIFEPKDVMKAKGEILPANFNMEG